MEKSNREKALDASVAIAVAFAQSAKQYNANSVVAVAKTIEDYLDGTTDEQKGDRAVQA